MPSSVDASDLIRLAADGAQLVEVLPEPEYLEEHLPGAMRGQGGAPHDPGRGWGFRSA